MNLQTKYLNHLFNQGNQYISTTMGKVAREIAGTLKSK